MPKVRTFSRTFPPYHPKAGQPAYFVEKFYNSFGINYFDEVYMLRLLKHLNPDKEDSLLIAFLDSLNQNIHSEKKHTIRAGNHFKNDDLMQLAVWSGKLYRSPQIKLLEPLFVSCYRFYKDSEFRMPAATPSITIKNIAENDGLSVEDFESWFNQPFNGQIISWFPKIY